ncbi:MAG TPA: hypothetical protein ENN21_11455 [Spirochaetes bacterium]|nr:hypothetical protein [Spirochaetota bacterium]
MNDFSFSSNAGSIEIAVFDEDRLAVGIAGSPFDDGLYLYSKKKKSLKLISSRPSYSLYVR